MGLDGVELVMEVEEAFGIVIPDADAETIRTVGDLYRFVLAKMDGPTTEPSGCFSASEFYRLRRQLMGLFRIERRRIRPDSTLEELFPAEGRKDAWRRLGEGLGSKLPELRRPEWARTVWAGLCLGLAVLMVVAWGRGAGFAGELVVLVPVGLVVGAIALGIAVHRLTTPFAIVPPAADLRGLIPMIVGANLGTFRIGNPRGWGSREVWEALVSIISTQLGVPPDMIAESSRFVDDLGMD